MLPILKPKLSQILHTEPFGQNCGNPVLRTHLVPYHQDDNEDEHGGHDDAANDDDHSAAQELRLHEVAPHVLGLGGELHAADHPRSRQRGDDVVVDGQHAQVILGPRRQVVDKEVLAGGRDHPGGGEEGGDTRETDKV